MYVSSAAIGQRKVTLRRALSPDEEQSVTSILAYPFTQVRERVRKEGRIPAEQIEEAIDEFRKFLILARLSSEELAMISPKVDEVWHAFILFTHDYAAFCDVVFGGFLHHIPATSLMPPSPDGRPNFIRGYRELFGDLPAIWGVGSLEVIVGRAVTDSLFRKLLFSDPHTALAGYQLIDEEIAMLEELPRELLDALASEMEANLHPHPLSRL